MEQDIIQEFAKTQPQEDSSLNKDIIQEYVSQLKSAETTETTEEQQAQTALETEQSEVVEQPESTETVVEDAITNVEDDIIDEEAFIQQLTGGRFSTREEIESAINAEKQIKFENKTSEAIYNMLSEGKVNEVYSILQKKMIAEEVKGKSEEQILKAYIKHSNPEFDDLDVEDEYNERYTIDEFSYDESKLKREQKKLNQKIKSDVLSAQEFFQKLSEDVKFPQYAKEEVVEEVDDSEAQEYRQKFLSSLDEASKRSVSLPLSWKDEKSNISVDGKFDIPVQELSKYRSGAENITDYLADKYYQDGKYKADALLRDLYIADNLDKIVSSFVSQAVNATRLAILKSDKNITFEDSPSGTFKPSSADEERTMLERLFNGHLNKQN